MKYKIFIGFILLFAVLQFFTIEKISYEASTNNDLFNVEMAPDELRKLITNICYDCHSDQVNYPWYSEVSPFSWWIQDHIKEGREHLNFSNWGAYDRDKKAHKAEEAYEEVGEGEMPLKSYAFIHREANLSEQEKALLVEWFKQLESKYR